LKPEELCKKILGLSDAVMEVSILDDQGGVLSRVSRNPAQSKYEPTKETYQKYGTWIKLSFSMAQETDTIFGPTEYIAIAHKNFKHAAVLMPQGSGFAAMVLDRTADVERVASLIHAAIGSGRGRTTAESQENSHGPGRRIGASS
jgi:hypothetical protein